MKAILVNGNLPLLAAHAISEGVVEIRCPAGLSVLKFEDAYKFASDIIKELASMNYPNHDEVQSERK